MAITGLVGDQTSKKAVKFGFAPVDLDRTVSDFLHELEQQTQIGVLVALRFSRGHIATAVVRS